MWERMKRELVGAVDGCDDQLRVESIASWWVVAAAAGSRALGTSRLCTQARHREDGIRTPWAARMAARAWDQRSTIRSQVTHAAAGAS